MHHAFPGLAGGPSSVGHPIASIARAVCTSRTRVLALMDSKPMPSAALNAPMSNLSQATRNHRRWLAYRLHRRHSGQASATFEPLGLRPALTKEPKAVDPPEGAGPRPVRPRGHPRQPSASARRISPPRARAASTRSTQRSDGSRPWPGAGDLSEICRCAHADCGPGRGLAVLVYQVDFYVSRRRLVLLDTP